MGLVRDYLELEFRSAAASAPFGFDLERVIDDFVLFCMLIGNDFLPCARALSLLSRCLVVPSGSWVHKSGSGHGEGLVTLRVPLPVIVLYDAPLVTGIPCRGYASENDFASNGVLVEPVLTARPSGAAM